MTRLLAALGALAGCAGGVDSDPIAPCRRAVVTDIDETLTTLDEEFLDQLLDPAHDPAMRPDANTLMSGFAGRGYAVLYVTARGEAMSLPDGRSAREATEDWLDAHGFPRSTADVFLAPDLPVFGPDAAAYKTEALLALEADGVELAYAYGNAESDIEAFLAAAVPADRIWLVGELAGGLGVNPLPDDQAFTAHLPALEDVPPACP